MIFGGAKFQASNIIIRHAFLLYLLKPDVLKQSVLNLALFKQVCNVINQIIFAIRLDE